MVIDSTTMAGFPRRCRRAGERPSRRPRPRCSSTAPSPTRPASGTGSLASPPPGTTWAPPGGGGHGVGKDRAEGLRFEDYVADTLTVLDALAPPVPPVVVGHSLGGLIAAADRRARSGPGDRPAGLGATGDAHRAGGALPRFVPQLPRIMSGRPFIMGNDACSVLALNEVPEPERPAIHAHLTHESGAVYRSLMLEAGCGSTPARSACRCSSPRDRRTASCPLRLNRQTARHYGVEGARTRARPLDRAGARLGAGRRRRPAMAGGRAPARLTP